MEMSDEKNIPVRCPYCGKVMVEGVVYGSSSIGGRLKWIPATKPWGGLVGCLYKGIILEKDYPEVTMYYCDEDKIMLVKL